jgi:hypothetical protein
MLGELIFINFINLIVVAVFLWFAKNSQKSTALLALIYAAVVAGIIFLSVPKALEFLGPVANFLLSWAVFYAMRRSQSFLLTLLGSLIGGLLMLYVAYLPVAFLQSMVLSGI